jgi:pyruvate/2-oxoglutarate dehydrogenase complex dihydrolipoamide acyltransferase (E2) component
MRRPRKLALIGAGAAGVLAIGLSVPAFAATSDNPSPAPSTSSSSAPSSSSSSKSSWADKAKDRAKDRQDKLADGLAKELGIDKSKVSDALTKVEKQLAADAKAQRGEKLKDRLAQAVKDGKLTQAQADAITAAASKGVLPGGGGWNGPRGGHNWGQQNSK